MSVDSLELLVQKAKEDTLKAKMLGEISFRYAFNEPEKGLLYSRQCLDLAQKLSYEEGVADAYQSWAWCLWAMGNYSNSLQLALKSLHQYESVNDWERTGWLYLTLAVIYRDIGDHKKALANAHRGRRLYDSLRLSLKIPLAVTASIYEKQNLLDSALVYVQKAYAMDLIDNQGKWGSLLYLQGNIEAKKKHYDIALPYYRNALPLAIAANIKKDIVDIYNSLATLYKETGKIDSSIFYANEVLQKWSVTSYQKGVLEATNILAQAYKAKKQSDSAIKYLELSVSLNNKLFNLDNERDIQNLAFNEQQREEEIARQGTLYRTKLKIYTLVSAGLVFLIIALILWRNNRHKQKANILLQQQKEKVESTLSELKTTQAQLIHSEKMASLGELTAGIAHEIQNPLNFVNNFSEVNNELIVEMNDELDKGAISKAKVVASDIQQNLEKICHHGRRADAIVKGMLQHSQTSTGKKEPTDINALADEYLRLSYQGLRAKDKAFNAEIKTDFDESMGKINIIPQDIGRVLLNLYSNAFYSLNEKKKQQPEDYKPTISVNTRKLNGKVEINVRDNGNGIPQKILDKIFQPFFTNKPTGQGTGLGLSLSYDVVKAHGGEIKVDTKEKEGAEFKITLPIT